MNFLAVLLIIILVTLTVKTYRSWLSTGISITLLFALTIAALMWGLHQFSIDPAWSLFGKGITRSVYLHFIIFWFITDICCAVMIVRSHLKYRAINFTAAETEN